MIDQETQEQIQLLLSFEETNIQLCQYQELLGKTTHAWQLTRKALMWKYCEEIGSDSIDGLHVCDDYLEWEQKEISRFK